jgi:hypothetical protein
MTKWQDFFQRQGTAPPRPYTVDYEKEYEIDTDVFGRTISFNWPLQQRGLWKDKITGKAMRDTVTT